MRQNYSKTGFTIVQERPVRKQFKMITWVVGNGWRLFNKRGVGLVLALDPCSWQSLEMRR